MKLLCKAIIGTFLSIPLYAAQHGPLPAVQDVHPLVVSPVADEKIKAFEQKLTSQEKMRSFMQVVTVGGAAVGTGVLLYKYFNPTPAQLTQNQELDSLKQRVAQLEAQQQQNQQNQANNQAASQGWGGWLKQKVISAKNAVADLAPGLAKDLVRYQAYNTATSMLWAALPFSASIGSYLFQSRTMNWCMTIKTKFYHSASVLLNWANQLEIDIRRAQSMGHAPLVKEYYMRDLTASLVGFVGEMEKVLGYMHFIVTRLTEDQADKKQRAYVCIDLIRNEVDGLVVKANSLRGSTHMHEMVQMDTDIRDALYKIICQMENFEDVHHAAGYDGAGEIDSYHAWKRFVSDRYILPAPPAGQNPGQLHLPPNPEEERHVATSEIPHAPELPGNPPLVVPGNPPQLRQDVSPLQIHQARNAASERRRRMLTQIAMTVVPAVAS